MPAFPKNVKPKCNYENVKYSREKKISPQVTVFSCLVNEKRGMNFIYKETKLERKIIREKEEEINNGSNFIHFMCRFIYCRNVCVY